jgi:hypothetical protein
MATSHACSFTPTVEAVQPRKGSPTLYGRMEDKAGRASPPGKPSIAAQGPGKKALPFRRHHFCLNGEEILAREQVESGRSHLHRNNGAVREE